MAINNRTVAQVQAGLSATDTTEDAFQTDTNNMIAQVDRSVNRVDIQGAMTGSATLAAGTTDNAIQIDVAARAAGDTYVDVNGNTVTYPGLVQGDIAPTAKRRLRIQDSAGTTVFEGDLLVP